MVDENRDRLVDNTDSGGDTGSGDGEPDPTDELPTVDVSFDFAPGTTMPQSRLGQPDQVPLTSISDLATIDSVSLDIRQGSGTYLAHTRKITPDHWLANIQFKSSGNASLTPRVSYTVNSSGKKIFFFGKEIQVTVDPTLRHPLKVELEGKLSSRDPGRTTQQATNGKIDKPIAITPSDAATFPTLYVTAKHAASVQVVCRFVHQDPNKSGTLSFGLRRDNPGSRDLPWKVQLVILESAAPATVTLDINDTDYFGVTFTTTVTFSTIDDTPPRIEFTKPHEGFSLISGSPISTSNPFLIDISGTVQDPQSGFPGTSIKLFVRSKEYTVPVPDGVNWQVQVPIEEVGNYEVTASAIDGKGNQGNSGNTRRRFSVARGFRPQTLEELLSQSAYLRELQRFVRDHLTKPGGSGRLAIDAPTLRAAFIQPIGDIGQADPDQALRPISELLPAIRLLRDIDRASPADLLNSVDSSGLIGRWNFADLERGAPDGMQDVSGRYQLNGVYKGPAGKSQAEITSVLSGVGTELQGQGALVLTDRTYSAVIPVPPLRSPEVLQLGLEDRDFSLSFWIYPLAAPNGQWRQVLYKGNDPGGFVTCGVWLMENDHRVFYRVKQADGTLQHCATTQALPQQRWSHVACIKSQSCLQIWINGRLNNEVALKHKVVETPGDFYIGTSPNQPGFVGGLADLRIYGFALDGASIAELAINQLAPTPRLPLLADYLQLSYETLLRGIGTSLEELRNLNRLSPSQRAELALRLGLDLPTGKAPDGLDLLLRPDYFATTGKEQDSEDWLSSRFGLPPTVTPTTENSLHVLVQERRKSLSVRWLRDDTGRTTPDLDPDVVETVDLEPAATEWVQRQRERRAELERQFQKFVALFSDQKFATAIADVFTAAEQSEIVKLADRERSGETIVGELSRFNLDMPMFRRLRPYLEQPNILLTREEGEDLAHLLTQLWKVRTRFQVWRDEESTSSSKLWPTISARSAWRPGAYKQNYWPWRANAQQRSDLEARLSGRIRAWQIIQDEQDSAVSEAHRIALPKLRDRLLGLDDLPRTQRFLNDLSERWLIDFGASGGQVTTRTEQAIASLQTLINGVVGAWFEIQHPANSWTVSPDGKLQWASISTYRDWQSSVLSYLYPENALYPELRNGSPQFKAFITALKKRQPISLEDTMDPQSDIVKAKAAIADDKEKNVFAPLAMGLAFQNAGLYAYALEQYGQFYDRSTSVQSRRRYDPLKSEPNDKAPIVNFGNPLWAKSLDNPHSVASTSGCQNPYTRFTLFQILRCILAQADDAFAAGTRDDRARAVALYIEASEILDFEELQDRQPDNALEVAYLPSPVLTSFRAHTEAALRKLRSGLNFLGIPIPSSSVDTGVAIQRGITRPTPYRYRVLIERAKQLAAQSQQIESQYFAAIEGGDREGEKLLANGFQLESARQTVRLRELHQTETKDGLSAAQAQQERSQIQRDRYHAWISAGPSYLEQAQIDNIWAAKDARDAVQVVDALITPATVSGNTGITNLFSGISATAVVTAAVGGRAAAQLVLSANETMAQLYSIRASQERRSQEWQFQQDLAEQDIAIGDIQISLANDRIAIADQEHTMAQTQATQAQQMQMFLRQKTTSKFFYDWLQDELRNIYVTFLRLATATARHAELQLAFERQERAAGIVRADYWQVAMASAAAASSTQGSFSSDKPPIDAKGITGSARLAQDIYVLDQHALSTDRRALNLSQSFSLGRLMPAEFEAFRRTGQLTFATPMLWFDEGFPGHYMRMIKKMRVSVSALIPPSIGIRATLLNNGLSRVVTPQAGFSTTVIQQPPQMVALTSPIGATGVFELDTQTDLLYPFEGTGVDTVWSLELPRAANPFDFDTLMDVTISIDYTALFSPELRDRIVKSLPRQLVADRVFSLKRDLPDGWYELVNTRPAVTTASVVLPISLHDVVPGLSDVRVQEVVVSVRSTTGQDCAYRVEWKAVPSKGAVVSGAAMQAIKGIASTRQSAGSAWRDALGHIGPLETEPIRWEWQLTDASTVGTAGPPPFLQQLRDGEVDDILIVTTFRGTRPPW